MRPLPSASSFSPRRRSCYEDPDTLSQPPPSAPLDCFITAESDLHLAGSCQEESKTPMRLLAHKYHDASKSLSVETSSASCHPGPAPLPSSFEMDRDNLPTSPIVGHHTVPGSRSTASLCSSPRDSSSDSLIEDHRSPMASFSEIPPNRSPVPSLSSAPWRCQVPQLVMPSVLVPQRRPFTETGRSMGKLKLLVAGRDGQPCTLSSGHILQRSDYF